MNPYIDEDLAVLGEHARRFAQGRVAPGFIERDATRVLDRGLMREMGEMGFIALQAGDSAAAPPHSRPLGSVAVRSSIQVSASRVGTSPCRSRSSM